MKTVVIYTNRMKTAKEILHKHTADETAIDYLRDIIVECMEEYANQQYKQGWDDRVKEAMKRVRTRPIKRL